MATNANATTLAQELEEIRIRLEWLDGERRKTTRKLAEMEQRVELQVRELDGREQRIKDLERQLASTNAQLARLPQVDTQLAHFKDEIIQMIEQYDQRRIQAEDELDRLRRVEHEVTARELADIRKDIVSIPRLHSDLDLRQAEEARLANLIGVQKNKLGALENQVETWANSFTFLEQKEKQNSRHISEIQTNFPEINKRWEYIYSRLDTLQSAISRLENGLQGLAEDQKALQESTKGWMEQIQIGEYERNQRLESWRRVLDEHTDTIERFGKQWVTFSDQYKEAKMAVQTLSQWQEQIEKQQREAAELLRMETHRMQSRWDTFVHEDEKKWKNFEVDAEQRWLAANRHEREVREQMNVVEEALERLKQEKDLIWRVQAAQADAMKQFPRIWLEEVEKALSQNPGRRRQPALVPVREE